MATIQVRISDEDKEAAERVLKALGIELTVAVRVFLKAVIRCKGIPFEITNSTEEDAVICSNEL